MSIGKTFTNAIIREIGRNYGKAISNTLMGDSHSTPVRMIGGIDRMRGRTYRNNFDEAVLKFSIKGAASTFNQALNVHSEYFVLVSEAKMDGAVDIGELEYLVKELPRARQTLKRAESGLEDHNDKRVEVVKEKISEVDDFAKELDDSLIIENLPKLRGWWIMILGLFLSFIGLDTLVFSKKITRYLSVVFLSVAIGLGAYTGYFKLCIFSYLGFYNFLNVYSTFDGFWRARSNNRLQRNWNNRAKEVKRSLQIYLSS